ncbi:MAG: ASCH domain-containing protein [Desulfobacterales bacterium]|nr:ASCH domain-containing protein [Desulfobacterales bacterium]
MSVLHLTLHRKWFDAIAKGRKKVEYREMKRYWHSRLAGRCYDQICFRNGYATKAPTMIVECLGIVMNHCCGRYEIKLGRILEIKNWTDGPGETSDYG